MPLLPGAWPRRRAPRRRAGLRDRVGEGPHGQARRLRAGGRRRRSHHAAPARRGRRRLPRLRAREAQARARRLRRPDHRAAPTCSSATPSSPPRNAGASATSSSTSSRTPAPRSSACCGPGSATAATCAWSAIPTRRSTASPAPTRRTSPASGAGSRPSSSPTSACVRLGSNYRSSPQVVAAASAVLAPARPAPAPRARRATRRSPPRVPEYDTAEDEARGVARALRDAESAHLRWSRMAVLYRVNAQSALFEEAFARAGVPFRVRGRRPLPRPTRGEGRARSAPQVGARGARPTLRRAPHRLRHRRRRPRRGAPRARRRARAPRATSTSRPTAAAAASTASSSSCRRRCAATTPARRSGDAVELLTFHRAKGLEFDTVFVTGLEKGLVPISHAKTPEAMDEEQRLLYVALSRAERVLHLSWARRAHGRRPHRPAQPEQLARPRRRRRAPRRRAPPTGPTATRAGASPTPATASPAASGGSTARKAPADVAAADAPLYAALVDWRLRQSRAASAPAYVIFPNTTLAAIASARPREHAGAARRARRRAGEGRTLRRGRPRAGGRAPALGVGVRPDRRLTGPRAGPRWERDQPAALTHRRRLALPRLRGVRAGDRRRGRPRPARAARRSARVRRPHRARVLRGVVALRPHRRRRTR